MKTIHVMLDQSLLARLDAGAEVRRDGRSAVLRRAADEYLRRKRWREIVDQYAEAYEAAGRLDRELRGWTNEGVWPAS